jgi:sec-independent protein translocase protein TatA
MGRLFGEPWVIGTIIVVAVLLFSAPKLPAMARSLGQSIRILKSEMREGEPEAPTGSATITDDDVISSRS